MLAVLFRLSNQNESYGYYYCLLAGSGIKLFKSFETCQHFIFNLKRLRLPFELLKFYGSSIQL